MFLRARIVVPVSRPPIADGAIRIEGKRIKWVGRWTETQRIGREDVLDLGETILMPGLINAHCHLDYTDMAGQIPPPRSFTQWIQSMVALKAAWSPDQFTQSWHHGAEMLVRTGTTTVASVEATLEHAPELWRTTPLRMISFRELIRLQGGSAAREAVDAAVGQWRDAGGTDNRAGLSPHAPYTTTRDLLERASAVAEEKRWPLMTHVAESEEEFEMFMYRHGPMFDWLKSRRDLSDCGLGSPVQHLERCGYLTRNLVAVHVNYLWRHDAGLLANNQTSVAHCPRSHVYFRHLKFPRDELAQAGVNLCLGTDSLATAHKVPGDVLELSMFSEMQTFAAEFPTLSPETILGMATVNAASAFGQAGRLGELTEDAFADLIALPYAGPLEDVFGMIVHHRGGVQASMINGRWALPPQPSNLAHPA